MINNRPRLAFSLVVGVVLTAVLASIPLGAQQPPPGGGPPGGPGQRGGGGADKPPNLPANNNAASSTVARTKLRHEWVDIAAGNQRLRAWIEYPDGEGKAPVVLVLQDEPGIENWIRAVADQLAAEGFIAVAPDLFSGFGPNGGDYDSFKTPDEAMRIAGPKLTPNEAMRRVRATAAFAARLPRANGAIGTLGIGTGGTLSFRAAAEASMVKAAVVFYGVAPDATVLGRIKIPVIGFYGEDDDAVVSSLASTTATMQRLGKSFDIHRYAGATHSFLHYQLTGLNGPATQDAWPRATAFLKQHLLNAAGKSQQ